MKLKNLNREPIAYEIIPKVGHPSPIMVDARGTVNVPSFARLSPTEAQEVAMSILFAAALADLEGNLPGSAFKSTHQIVTPPPAAGGANAT